VVRPVRRERFADHAQGRPFHAALIEMRGPHRPHGHHDYVEVMAVVGGEGRQDLVTAGGDTHTERLTPGWLMLLRPLDQHTLAGTGTRGMTFYNIAFPATGWHAFADLAGLDPGWSTAEAPPRARFDATDAQATGVFARALDRFWDNPTALDLIRFWTDAVALLAPPATDPDRPPGAPPWLLAACAAMRDEEHLRAGVPRLLALAHVSPAHLARSVRRFYGRTPTDLVAELRLRHAATLLARSSGSVTDIAYRCGFASPSYFTRRFRHAYLASPREYRQRAQRAFVP
jgi:AraC-like DNA-binding protein